MQHDLVEFFTLDPSAAPLHLITDETLARYGVTLFLKREDLLHPQVTGNKWRKLKYNLIRAHELGHTKLLTFGGAYSNHILATAVAGSLLGFETIGIIRGEEYSPLNPVLQQAQEHGMDLHYMTRATYRHKMSESTLVKLRDQHGQFYLLPEGGSNALAVRGCSEIVRDLQHAEFDLLVAPCGTGGTLAGLIDGLHTYFPNSAKRAVGISVLNSKPANGSKMDFLTQTIRDLLPADNSIDWSINHECAHGGYAKTTPSLLNFIEWFEQTHNITLDPIYTGKMLFAIYDLVQNGAFASGITIVAILTGRENRLYE